MSVAVQKLNSSEQSHQYAGLERITPELAAQYLESNTSNRPVRPSHLKRLAEEMTSGKWKTNGDTIKFSRSGRLLDGQHRLHACIVAGVPFWAYIVRGLDEEVFDTIDVCAIRNARDVLSIAGEDNSAELGRLLTLVWRMDNNFLGSHRTPNNRQRLETLSWHSEVRESLAFAMALDIRHIAPIPLAAFLHLVGSPIDEQKTKEFLVAVATGDNLAKTHPAFVFRETMLKQKALPRTAQIARHHADYPTAYGIKALQAFFNGEEIVRYLHYKSTESFPVLVRP